MRSVAQETSAAPRPSAPCRAPRPSRRRSRWRGRRGREQRGLVHQIREIAPEKPGVPRAIERRSTAGASDLAGVHAQDRFAALDVGVADHDLAIEAARAEQRRIEDVLAVRGGNHDDALVGFEAVHLDEQLVERLLALLVAERIAAAAAADGVELVDEDDAGLWRRGVAEQPADARRPRRRHTSRRSPSRWQTGTARPLRPRSTAPAASCPCPAGRRAARPSESPPIAEKRSGSRRKSTISFTSSFASSTPATSLNVITCPPRSAKRPRTKWTYAPRRGLIDSEGKQRKKPDEEASRPS